MLRVSHHTYQLMHLHLCRYLHVGDAMHRASTNFLLSAHDVHPHHVHVHAIVPLA